MNFDESRTPPLQLPPVLRCEDGSLVEDVKQWRTRRRPELLELFARHVYGRPLPPVPVAARVVEEASGALGGRATRRQVELTFPTHPGKTLHLALYLPEGVQGPVPCFLGLNFFGNHAAFADPAIHLSRAWIRPDGQGVVANRATEASRGSEASRWPLERIIERGYAVATIYYGDLEPDHPDGFAESARALFYNPAAPRELQDPGAICAWAWGLSRAMDYLATEPRIDPARIGLTGHSRLGKAALWAAAWDERFAFVISNNSGCGGASLNRRGFGETLHILSNVRPHWYREACRHGADPAERLPVDQHQLLALLAPRPVLVSSAEADPGADPKGERLGAHHAAEAYHLYGLAGVPAERPPLGEPVLNAVGYFIRPGEHAITALDWEAHLAFTDHHLRQGPACSGAVNGLPS